MVREVRLGYGPHSTVAEVPRIVGPGAVAALVRGWIGGEPREHFFAIFLDGRHRPIGWRLISVGTLTASIVHPREVFGPALMAHAAAVIVAHNHPSGDAQPSAEDRDITKRLERAGKLLGVRLLDHVVVSEEGFVSISERGEG
jgi:DNA repair protein RadC